MVVALFLLAGASTGVVWVHAAGTPTIQYGPTVLSGSATNAVDPAVSTSNDGLHVYVAWTQGGGGILFTSSSNGGSAFNAPFKITNQKGVTSYPVMITGDGYQSVSAGDVYVVWTQTISNVQQIFIASSTNYGAKGSFTTTQLSTTGGNTPAMAGWGSDVYVSWFQNSSCPVTALNPSGEACNYVVNSSNNGASWSAPVEMNPSPGIGESQIVASGNYAFFTADGIYFSSLGVAPSNWDGSGTIPTGWTKPVLLYAHVSVNGVPSFGREPWVAASGLDVYVTWEAINLTLSTSSNFIYSDYGVTSTNGGVTWYPGTCNSLTCSGSQLTSFPPSIKTAAQQAAFLMSGYALDTWEPENAAFGSMATLTVHSLKGQGIFMTSTTNDGGSWSTPQQVNKGMHGASSFAHVFTSDGVNVWVMWGQKLPKSTTWNAYVSYSGDSGTTWSAPLDISNNAAGVAAGNKDVTLFWVSSIGTTCFAVYSYSSGTTHQIWFTSITA